MFAATFKSPQPRKGYTCLRGIRLGLTQTRLYNVSCTVSTQLIWCRNPAKEGFFMTQLIYLGVSLIRVFLNIMLIHIYVFLTPPLKCHFYIVSGVLQCSISNYVCSKTEVHTIHVKSSRSIRKSLDSELNVLYSDNDSIEPFPFRNRTFDV